MMPQISHHGVVYNSSTRFIQKNMPSRSDRMMEDSNVLLDAPDPHYTNPVSIPPSNVMVSELQRLKSYRNWNVPFLPPQIMAKAGFFYTGIRDIVKCPFCGVEVMSWENGDDPWDDHRKWRSTCSFINDEPGHGNIPLSQEETLININGANSPPSPNDSGYDTCGSQEIKGMDKTRNNLRLSIQTSTSGGSNSILKMKSPTFPMFASKENRLASYSSWPVSLKIKPNILSEAGFYYTGKGDQTVCFYCGGGLKDWEDVDDPWTEHAKWFSKCTFVLLNKGEQFVEEAKKALPGVKVEDTQPSKLNTSESASEASCSGSSQDDAMSCKICYNKPLQVVFLPCGHLMSCIDCSLKLKQCSACRTNITNVVRTFLP